jgi:ribonuclease J
VESTINDLIKINSFDGASYVYSLWKGYLEEESMKKILNFIRLNKIAYYLLHTSGHASINTLKKMVNTLKPAKIIPIHTFHPDKYNQLWVNIVNVSDGEIIEI